MASTAACFLQCSTPAAAAARTHSSRLICRAHKQAADDVVSRRLALTLFIGGAALASRVSPADAAYGESDFRVYSGDGFKVSLPSKWNPSDEIEYPGQVLRYEDNFDASSNLVVTITPTDKKSITDFGSPEKFLSKVDYLLGKQAYFGKTDAEGGFDSGVVATANILEESPPTIDGKQYYFLSVLTRTADGDEGGKHQLISATVKDGKLYICKAQAGDKRWFKGARKFVEKAANSFKVA